MGVKVNSIATLLIKFKFLGLVYTYFKLFLLFLMIMKKSATFRVKNRY
jgi:hypothetical protein